MWSRTLSAGYLWSHACSAHTILARQLCFFRWALFGLERYKQGVLLETEWLLVCEHRCVLLCTGKSISSVIMKRMDPLGSSQRFFLMTSQKAFPCPYHLCSLWAHFIAHYGSRFTSENNVFIILFFQLLNDIYCQEAKWTKLAMVFLSPLVIETCILSPIQWGK